jgi:hypothetical protein
LHHGRKACKHWLPHVAEVSCEIEGQPGDSRHWGESWPCCKTLSQKCGHVSYLILRARRITWLVCRLLVRRALPSPPGALRVNIGRQLVEDVSTRSEKLVADSVAFRLNAFWVWASSALRNLCTSDGSCKRVRDHVGRNRIDRTCRQHCSLHPFKSPSPSSQVMSHRVFASFELLG